MYPAYRYMPPYPQSFPIHGEPNQYPYQHFPNKGATSPDIRADVFEPWPHNVPFSHPNPAEPHSCCNHSYPSGYYSFRPPYSHMQTPPQMYYHGPYPPHPEPYPTYFAPPPYYSVDPGMAKYHCCGCPNHVCNPGGSSVKIEEHPHESEPGNKDDSNLIRLPNKAPPAAWFPPSYSKSGNDSESSFQLDPNILKGLRHGGEMNRRHGNDERMQFPWPIWWMPGNEKVQNAGKDVKEVDTGANSSEEPPSKFTIVPMKLLEDGRRGQKPETGENVAINQAHPEALSANKTKSRIIPAHPETVSNKTKTRTIPVVEMKPSVIEKPKENSDEQKSIVPDNPASGVKRASESKPAPTKKPTKLPPVCLRVDPLPKKKSGNGASGAPSRPLKEERAHQENKDQLPATHQRKDESLKKNIRVFDMDGKSSEQVVVPVVSSKNSSATTAVVNSGKKDTEENNELPKISVQISPRQECEERKERRRDLTETEAIRIIQSAYRGWEVRRSQPLHKLKKIVSIRDQVANVKAQIEGIEADPKQNELKRRVFISETIMNLLLQLDSIQGLHPSLREIRKSIAKDLVSLQEKLDYLGSQTVAQFDSASVEGNTCEATPNYASLGVSSSAMAEAASENGDDGGAMHPSPVVLNESESNQQRHESTIPVDGQALEASHEHSVELPPLTEAKDRSCCFEESRASRPGEEENHASREINEDANRTAEASENASLDLGSQELQESKESGFLVPAASNYESLGVTSSPLAEPASENSHVQPGSEHGGLLHPLTVVGKETESDQQRHEGIIPLDGRALEASHGHSVELSTPTEAKDLSCCLEESRELGPVAEENHDSGVINEDTTENASLDLGLQELQESKESECPVSAASNDGCLGVSSSPMAEPAPTSQHVQPVSEDGGITHPSPALLSESESDHQRHESTLPVDGQTLEASHEHPVEPSSLTEAGDSRESRPIEEEKQASEVIIEDATMTPEVAFLTENPSPDLGLHEPQESNGTCNAETEETKEVILEIDKPSDERGSNQEEKPPVQVIESKEVVAVVKAEELEFKDTKEEPLNQLTGEGDTKEEEYELLPSIEESSHGEQKTQETLAKSTDAISPIPEVEKDLSKAQIESEAGKEVARETIGSSYSEAPLEASVNNALDEGIKDSEDNSVLALKGVSDRPEDETPIGASALESRSEEKKLIEENEKLRAMLENLIEAGKQQLGVISELNERVKGLEKKMPQKKRVKLRRNKLGKGVSLS